VHEQGDPLTVFFPSKVVAIVMRRKPILQQRGLLVVLIIVTGVVLSPPPCSCHALSVSLPDLQTLSPALYQTKLNFRVAVGDPEEPFQMQGLHVELGSRCRTPKRYSTGLHEAQMLGDDTSKPFFVNRDGRQTVHLEHGGWEVMWRKPSPHGHLVCSFVNPTRLKRNEATFQAGRFFMYHRCWTKATLESERKRRRRLQAEASKFLNDRDQKVKKITEEEGNALEKVVSYGQAARSMNQYRTLGLKEAQFIPLYDDQVLELTPDCIVSTRGLIFMVNGRQPEEIGRSRVDFFERTMNAALEFC